VVTSSIVSGVLSFICGRGKRISVPEQVAWVLKMDIKAAEVVLMTFGGANVSARAPCKASRLNHVKCNPNYIQGRNRWLKDNG